MMKRIIATLLCLTMVASMFTACGKQSEDETEVSESVTSESSAEESEAFPNGEIPLDYFAGTEVSFAFRNNVADQKPDEVAQKAGAKYIEEKTGIKVNWIPIDGNTYKEKTATLLAGDMPDIMFNLLKADQVTTNIDLFYDLSEEGLLETYAPDVYADYNTVGQAAWDACTWADGSIRGLLTGYQENPSEYMRGIWCINKNWLDQLNLPMPTTTDELYDVLCAFRDNDMNGNGDKTDEIPLSFSDPAGIYTSGVMYLANYFGIGSEREEILEFGKMVKDGKIVSTFDTQEFRDFLEFTHKLMDEGLMDAEGFSQSAERYTEKVNAGLVGVIGEAQPNAELGYVALPAIQAYDDVEAVLTGRRDVMYVDTRVQFNANTENIEACLFLWNFMASDQMCRQLMWQGEEGLFWEMTDDGKIKQFSTEELNALYTDGVYPGGYAYAESIATVGINNHGTYPFLSTANKEAWYVAEEEVPGSRNDIIMNELYDNILSEYLPTIRVADDVLQERDDLGVELDAYMSSFVGNAVMNGLTDADWDKHLKELDKVGYQEWLAWFQKYIDREF